MKLKSHRQMKGHLFSSNIPYKSHGNINNFQQKICTQWYHLQQFYILNQQIKKNQALYVHVVFLTVLINDSWLFTNFKFRLLLLRLYHTDLQFREYMISNCFRDSFANKEKNLFLIKVKQFDLMANNCRWWVYMYYSAVWFSHHLYYSKSDPCSEGQMEKVT